MEGTNQVSEKAAEIQEWHMVGLYQEDASGGMWGDDAIGEGYTAYYSNGRDEGAISYYVEECQTTNQPVVEDAFVVRWQSEFAPDGDFDQAQYDYGDASVLFYYTLEEAQYECRRNAWADESHVWLSPGSCLYHGEGGQ